MGVFNVQGSSWSRKKRQFHIHDPSPPLLQTLVRPSDVPIFAQGMASDAVTASDTQYALYSDSKKCLTLSELDEGLFISLASGSSDIVTVAPIFTSGSSLQLACIGLVNMLNAGGAVLDVKLVGKQSNSKAVSCEVCVKGCGQLLLYASLVPVKVTYADTDVDFEYQEDVKQLVVRIPESNKLQGSVQLRF